MASQQNIDAWWSWATGVLQGIGAPTSPANYQTLWKWSVKESGQDPIANGNIHNNPLNTTQRWPGSTSQNKVGVQSYPDISSGVQATVTTLTNGRYPAIITALKQSIASNSWAVGGGRSLIGQELTTWGSGGNWLQWSNSPPLPSSGFRSANPDLGSSVMAANAGPRTLTNLLPSVPNPLAGVGDAIQGAEQDLVTKATYVMLMIFGAIFMLGGLALIAVMALKYVPAPIKGVAGAVASATPVGRTAAVASSVAKKAPAPPTASPANKPLSPGAQASVAAAKAGRGSKLSPAVKAELRERTA